MKDSSGRTFLVPGTNYSLAGVSGAEARTHANDRFRHERTSIMSAGNDRLWSTAAGIADGRHLGCRNWSLSGRLGSSLLRSVLPAAIMATGDVSWDYQSSIPPPASGYHGMRDAESGRSVPSSPARFGQFVFIWINTAGFEIERFLIWLSTANCAVAIW